MCCCLSTADRSLPTSNLLCHVKTPFLQRELIFFKFILVVGQTVLTSMPVATNEDVDDRINAAFTRSSGTVCRTRLSQLDGEDAPVA